MHLPALPFHAAGRHVATLLAAAFIAAALVPAAAAPDAGGAAATLAVPYDGAHDSGSGRAVKLTGGGAGGRAWRVELPPSLSRGPGPQTQLHLIKIMQNAGGGTASESDWTLRATGSRTDGPTNLEGITPVDSGAGFLPDTYTLSEAYTGSDPQVAGSYDAAAHGASAWTCVDTGTGRPVEVTANAGDADAMVVVREGDDITCTITNRYKPNTPSCTAKIVGRKLYAAREGPFQGGEVGLSGWRVTATLVDRETLTVSTTTDALGAYEFTREMLGEMVFGGARIRVCEEDRPGWRNLTPLCRIVTLPNPLEGDCVPDVNFTNEQVWQPNGD